MLLLIPSLKELRSGIEVQFAQGNVATRKPCEKSPCCHLFLESSRICVMISILRANGISRMSFDREVPLRDGGDI